MKINVCNGHRENQVFLHSPCIGCELERLRAEIERLRAPDPRVEKLVLRLSELLDKIKSNHVIPTWLIDEYDFARAALNEWKEGK